MLLDKCLLKNCGYIHDTNAPLVKLVNLILSATETIDRVDFKTEKLFFIFFLKFTQWIDLALFELTSEELSAAFIKKNF